ncbi:MAG TPA: RNase adapter RapZ [Microthrixaceae bacterium]|nr:RNase adapter RapZ [Microthrixaceae bacterium]
MVDFVIVTGLSGAGRTQVGNTLEDLGWFVIDNLPSELIPKVSELARFKAGSTTPVALVVGTDGNQDDMARSLAELKATGAKVTTVFLDASTPTLVRRYGDTKRRHPLLADIGSVEDSIEEERRQLQIVRASADMILDTTDLNIHDLRKRVLELFTGMGGDGSTQITVMSFGFKHGVPSDVDMVLDCRFLPNPHWIDELRPMTGLDAAVQDYVGSFELTQLALERIESLLELLIPAYVDEGKSVLTIAFGCTGGRHRSVTIAEQIAAWMRGRGLEPRLRHRDVEK